MDKTRAIEINFQVPVDITQDDMREFDVLLTRICKRYKKEHPDRVMWVFGVGCKMLVNPLALGDDDPIPFSDDILAFEIAERERYENE